MVSVRKAPRLLHLLRKRLLHRGKPLLRPRALLLRPRALLLHPAAPLLRLLRLRRGRRLQRQAARLRVRAAHGRRLAGLRRLCNLLAKLVGGTRVDIGRTGLTALEGFLDDAEGLLRHDVRVPLDEGEPRVAVPGDELRQVLLQCLLDVRPGLVAGHGLLHDVWRLEEWRNHQEGAGVAAVDVEDHGEPMLLQHCQRVAHSFEPHEVPEERRSLFQGVATYLRQLPEEDARTTWHRQALRWLVEADHLLVREDALRLLPGRGELLHELGPELRHGRAVGLRQAGGAVLVPADGADDGVPLLRELGSVVVDQQLLLGIQPLRVLVVVEAQILEELGHQHGVGSWPWPCLGPAAHGLSRLLRRLGRLAGGLGLAGLGLSRGLLRRQQVRAGLSL
mmetsp:Transcript_41978/g.121445  ORF Transcript_41978/g.121445 Transcript_41978/m.121445 type:complete len:392 (-) Transcript_41978:524-1699(-)